MELMQQEAKGYSNSREEEEEEELAEIIREESSKQYYPFSSSSSLPSPPSTNYPNQNLWLGIVHDRIHHQHKSPEATTPSESYNLSSGLGLHQHQDAASASNFAINHQKLELMELSLGNNKEDEANFHGGCSSSTGLGNDVNIEKEHMFDKVVTPSDVGKLNRLVIPKQHAERCFPLDSSTNEKGLLLNFEDRNGKLWRFRYSYWNSSQSYVMTKGWSRFVKEKKLDAGDIVSFHRGVGELYRHRLYIDWTRRPDQHHHHGHDPTGSLITPLLLPNQPSQYSVRWAGRLYSLPSPVAPAPPHYPHLQQVNYHNMYPFHQLQPQQQHQLHYGSHQSEVNLGSGPLYYLRSTPGDRNLPGQPEGGNNGPMIIDSVPVAHGKSSSTSRTHTAGKRLRLFGVNMECASPAEEQPQYVTMASSQLPSSPSLPSTRFGNQKGETSALSDLGPSFQYRQ